MIKKVNLTMYLALAVMLPCVLTAKLSADIIYVDANATAGANDGSSWADAYISLQDGLDAALYFDEIWVAQGSYYPTTEVGGSGERYKTFQMVNGVALYGGFPNTGDPGWEDRDPNTYETILSGDLLGNDNPATPTEDLLDDPCRVDNSYHVVYSDDVDPNTILNGFSITGGNANGSGDQLYGGGMFNSSSSPTVTGCTFTGNSALAGGGIYNRESSNPTITNCTFTGNSAYYQGGGIYNNISSSPTVTGCAFNGNSVEGNGGGMYNNNSCNPTVSNCTFSGNSAKNNGGGMYNRDSSNSTIINCTFTSNTSSAGGGMYNTNSSDPNIVNCIFWGNTATYAGNEICNSDDSTPIISYCDIADCLYGGSWDTSLGANGGGNIDADPMFVDVAGGDFHLQGISPCINVGDNYAPSLPETDFEGDPRIIYGKVDMGVDELAGDMLFPLNVTLQPFAGAGNVTLNPAGGVYHPGTEVTLTVDAKEGYIFDHWSGDLAGNDSQVTIIMDSHKFVTAHFGFNGDVIYVDAAAAGANNGSSWNNAIVELQDALAVTAITPEARQILVARGIYKPTEPYGDRAATFQLVNGVALFGSFPTGGSSWEGRDPNINETILSGDLAGNDGPSFANNDENSYHVITCSYTDPNTILDGFTITGGNANGPHYPHAIGGGMYNSEYSNPTITNCTFSGNSASVGGGMANSSGSPTVTGCTFTGNTASIGGGMDNRNSSPTVINCTFTGNSVNNWGGGMSNFESSSTVINCAFTGNTTGDDGGGMSNSSYSPTINDCIFIGNNAEVHDEGVSSDGGGIYNFFYCKPKINNSIFIGVTAKGFGGGMCNDLDSHPTIIKCTFSGNTASIGGGMYHYYDCSSTVTNCTFNGNSASFYGGGMRNRVDMTITNCSFYGNLAKRGGGMYNGTSSPTITNCTFSGNSAAWGGGGMYSYGNSEPTISNCILWDNAGGEISGGNPIVSLSDVEGGWPGLGNIEVDPEFVDPGYWDPNSTPDDPNDDYWVDGDYHLKSQGWCWDRVNQRWAYDAVTSRCIDAGNPGMLLGDEPTIVPPDPTNEWGQNIRINMGVFGGTSEASMAPSGWSLLADLTNDGIVNLADSAHQAKDWQNTAHNLPGDLNRDGVVNILDLALKTRDWLMQTIWH